MGVLTRTFGRADASCISCFAAAALLSLSGSTGSMAVKADGTLMACTAASSRASTVSVRRIGTWYPVPQRASSQPCCRSTQAIGLHHLLLLSTLGSHLSPSTLSFPTCPQILLSFSRASAQLRSIQLHRKLRGKSSRNQLRLVNTSADRCT